MKILWTDPAVGDFQAIRDYIAKDSEVFAFDFVEQVIASVENLIVFPQMGRIVPEINRSNFREIIFQNYRVIYRLKSGDIQILAIVHGARDLINLDRSWEMKSNE